MGAIKEYMMDLAERKGVDFEEITEQDMELDFQEKAQKVFMNLESPQSELDKYKPFLPTKPYSEVKFYDGETGTPKFKVGDVMVDGDFTFYLIVA